MSVLQIIGAVYGIGVMFAMTLCLFMLVNFIVTKSSSELLKLSKQAPLAFFVGICHSLIWPFLIFKDYDFREAVVECGRIAAAGFYFMSAIMTFQYPWIWAWFIAYMVAWKLLEKYHYKFVPEGELQ